MKTFITCLALTLVACSAPPISPEDARAALESTADSLTKVTIQRDVDGIFTLFTDSADFTFVEDAVMKPPKEEFRQGVRDLYSQIEAWDLVWDTVRSTLLGPGAGVVTSVGHWEGTLRSGEETAGTVAATWVFRLRAGRWELVHGHASHGPPASG